MLIRSKSVLVLVLGDNYYSVQIPNMKIVPGPNNELVNERPADIVKEWRNEALKVAVATSATHVVMSKSFLASL